MLKNNIQTWITHKDIRFCHYYLQYLLSQNYLANWREGTAKELCQQANLAIANAAIPDEAKHLLVQQMKDSAASNLLPIEVFNWIKESGERCINWAWAYISVEQKANQSTVYAQQYSSLGLHSVTTNYQERFDKLVKFFDLYPASTQEQNLLINTMQSMWPHIGGGLQKKPFTWLDIEDEQQCQWAWRYFKTYGQKEGLLSTPPIDAFTPTSSKEMHSFLYAAFDVWSAGIESKKLFLISINKAWHQKKHRDNMKGKKACSFVLHNDVKIQLDELARANNMQKNEYLESLIKDAHKELTPSL